MNARNQNRVMASENGGGQERPAHQLHLGEPPAGQRQPAAPAERSSAASQSHWQRLRQYFRSRGSRISCGAPGRISPPQFRHPPNVAWAKRLEPPAPPAAPGQLDPIAAPTPRLHGDKILRQRLWLGSARLGLDGTHEGTATGDCPDFRASENGTVPFGLSHALNRGSANATSNPQSYRLCGDVGRKGPPPS